MQKEKIFMGIVAIVVAMGVGLYVLLPDDETATQMQSTLSEQIIFYYGDTCPHCKNVEAYVAENNVHEKVSFVEKEVYRNKENAQDLTNTAEQCGIEKEQVGVPLLWTGDACLIGDEDIIEFFEKKIGQDQMISE